ncbi:hypothetical protein OG21DRAFT_827857 [Imleria badia]|nr:hypothetical protein OG21DRAFT_827857 [Imleria badia]
MFCSEIHGQLSWPDRRLCPKPQRTTGSSVAPQPFHSVNSSQAEMPSYTPRFQSDFFKTLRGRLRRKTSTQAYHHSTTTEIPEIVSESAVPRSLLQLHPTPDSPPKSTTISTIYRNTSDAAQTFLPPIQAVADVVPGIGGVIKGVIGGMLSMLQLVDRYIQNKDDMEGLVLRLHLLLRLIENAPIARTTFEETMRRRLLNALETAKSQLGKMERRIRGSTSVTQDITGCITRINNQLLEYTVFTLMYLQNDVHEIKTSTDKIAHNFRQIQFIENFMATVGREHPMLLEQCRHLDLLDAMLSVVLCQCRPDEAEIQRWYIERGGGWALVCKVMRS